MMSWKLLPFFIVVLTFSATSSTLAAESDTYDFSWLDSDKEIFVLQNRKFRKAERVHVSVGGGLTTSGAFVDSSSIQFRGGYYFSENWGIEFLYSLNQGDENDTAAGVRNAGGAGSRPFRRIVENYYGGLITWSPFYMKMNTFNSIAYVDWIIGVGAGQLNETNNRPEFENQFDSEDITEKHTGFIWNLALQFYLTENFRVRTDFTAFNYQALNALGSEETFNSNYDLTIALGLTF